MRFGLWAAAAAAVLCSGQASAATFVKYEARGTGFVLTQDTSAAGFSTRTGDFLFDFVIQTDAGNGSQYTYQPNTNDTFSAAISLGSLTINGKYQTAGGYGYNYSSTINVPSYQVFTFAAIPTPTIAAGLVSYNYATTMGGILYSGAITSLVKVGTVAGFIEPSVSVLPEPATWAMMIVGCGMIGASLRRRGKRSTRLALA